MYHWDLVIGENIYFSDVENKVINLPAFQRMKSIKQTGFVYTEFPGAVHTRYEHSLGTTYWADSMYKAIRKELDDDQLKALRLAALLHDIGHGPFSHALDMLVYRNPKWAPVIDDYQITDTRIIAERKTHLKSHEQLTLEFIASEKSLHQLVDKRILVEVFKILSHQHKLSKIISADLDADRIDYLARDSYYSGFPFGRDIAHLFKHLIQNNLKYQTDKGEKDEELLVVEEDGVAALETFLIARFHSYMHIYHSPKTRAANLAFVKAMEKMLDRVEDPARAIYAVYKYLDDHDLLLGDFKKIPDKKLRYALDKEFNSVKPVFTELLTGKVSPKFALKRFITTEKEMVFNLIRAHRRRKLRLIEDKIGRQTYFDVFFPSGLATDVHVNIRGCSLDYSPLYIYDYSFLIRGLEQDMYMNSGIIVCDETKEELDDFIHRLARLDFKKVLKKRCDLDVILYGLKQYLNIIENIKKGPRWLAKRRGIYLILEELANEGFLKGYKFPKYYFSQQAYEALQILEFLGVIREQFVLVFAQATQGFIPSYQYSIDNEAYKELESLILLTDEDKRSIKEIVNSVTKQQCLYY
jgi:HD superfamily phosphohydrolase